MSRIISISSMPDLSLCKWFKSVDISLTPVLISSSFSLSFRYVMRFNNTPGTPAYLQHPEGVITFGWASSYDENNTKLENPQKFTIGPGSERATQHIEISAADLEKVWYVMVDIDGQSYTRLLSFASDLSVYQHNPADLASQFPELAHEAYKDRPNTGVCFSGGGSRALIMAMGQLRYLHQYRKNIKYISSVSGGSWASAIYTYSKQSSIENLLGEVLGTRSEYERQLNLKTVPKMAAGTAIPEGADGGGMVVFLVTNLLRSIARLSIRDYQSLEDSLPKEIVGTSDFKQEMSNLKNFVAKIPHELTLTFDKIWIESIGMNFFAPNGIYDFFYSSRDYFTLDDTSLQKLKDSPGSFSLKLKQGNTKLRTVSKYDNSSGKAVYPPYLIMNSLMLRPNSADVHSKASYVGYEYTPLYHGPAYNNYWDNGHIFIGGGNAPMQTYGAFKSTRVKNGITVVNFQSNVYAPSLAVASGTSSSAFAGFTSSNNVIDVLNLVALLIKNKISSETVLDEMQKLLLQSNNNKPYTVDVNGKKTNVAMTQNCLSGVLNFLVSASKFILELDIDAMTPKANYFNVKEAAAINLPSSFDSTRNVLFNFGDAGLSDNFGLMALLRRKVENIVVFVNTAEPLNVDYDGKTTVTDQMDTAVAAFFGMVDGERGQDGVDLTNLQVFDKSYFPKFIKDLQASRASGMMATTNIPLKGNEFWGIEATTEAVNVLWVYNNLPKDWTNLVGSDVMKAIDDLHSDSPANEKFPFMSTMGGTILGSSPFEVNMLSNLAYWSVENNAAELAKIIPRD